MTDEPTRIIPEFTTVVSLYDKQAVFDRVWDVYVNCAAPQCRDSRGSCVYSHSVNGYGCAVGCLLDRPAADWLDNFCDEAGLDTNILEVANYFEQDFSGADIGFLADLQHIHDNYSDRQALAHGISFTEKFRMEMRELAKEEGLVCPV